MSVLKVIEVLGNATVSFEDAVNIVINDASKTVKKYQICLCEGYASYR